MKSSNRWLSLLLAAFIAGGCGSSELSGSVGDGAAPGDSPQLLRFEHNSAPIDVAFPLHSRYKMPESRFPTAFPKAT
jgi:hypothetical protein